ncbi:hypothetical protein DKG79_00260 [Escherichia fergusonii]|nr:hypothetical protein DKG79_00260 [Escherichia fergusonii]
MMTSFIITLSLYKAPSSGGAFPFQPLADSPIVDERQTPRNAFQRQFSLPRAVTQNAATS